MDSGNDAMDNMYLYHLYEQKKQAIKRENPKIHNQGDTL